MIFFCSVPVWFWYRGEAGLVELVWKRTFLFHFWKSLRLGIIALHFGRSHQSSRLILDYCLLGGSGFNLLSKMIRFSTSGSVSGDCMFLGTSPSPWLANLGTELFTVVSYDPSYSVVSAATSFSFLFFLSPVTFFLGKFS